MASSAPFRRLSVLVFAAFIVGRCFRFAATGIRKHFIRHRLCGRSLGECVSRLCYRELLRDSFVSFIIVMDGPIILHYVLVRENLISVRVVEIEPR